MRRSFQNKVTVWLCAVSFWAMGCAMDPQYIGYEVESDTESSVEEDNSAGKMKPDKSQRRRCKSLGREAYLACMPKCEKSKKRCHEECRREARRVARACLDEIRPKDTE